MRCSRNECIDHGCKGYGYGDWTPQQLNDLIMLAYQLRRAEAELGWDADMIFTVVDSMVDLVNIVEKANE